MKKYPLTSPYVVRRSQLDLGLHIPVPVTFLAHPAFQQKSGVPNLLAIFVMAEILNWYRPIWEEADTSKGKRKPETYQRFEGDAFVLNYAYLSQRFGYSVWAVKRAVYFLRDRGLLILETRAVQDEQTGELVGKHTVAIPNFDRLAEILSPASWKGDLAEESTDAHSNARRSDEDQDARRSDEDTDAHTDEDTDAHTDEDTDAHPNARQLQKSIKQESLKQESLKQESKLTENPLTANPSENVAFGGFAASGDGGGDTQDLEFDFSRLEKPPGKAERKAWDAFLRAVGVPSRKLREPVLQALTEGRVTGLDVLAEFTRCFREAREGRLAKPAVAAAVNLARGSHRGGEEDRDPVRWWGVLGEKLQPLVSQGLVPPEEAAWAASQRLRLRKYKESPYAALYVQ